MERDLFDPYASSAARSRARRAAARRRRRRQRSAALVLLLLSTTAVAVIAVTRPFAHSRSARGISVRSHAILDPGEGRWLVPETGAQVTVAAENGHPGTTAWRLPGPAREVGGRAYGSVAGYASPTSPLPGAVERIYVRAPGAAWVRVRIFRIGWYGGAGGHEVFSSRRLALVTQPPCPHVYATGLTVCHWHATLTTRLPTTLASGVYVAVLRTATGERDTFFVVRARRPTPLLAQIPTATYEAYNAWGGDSLYPGGSDRVGVTGTTQGVEVAYDRPYDSITGAGQFFARDVAMVHFLERYRYPVSYTTSESVDAYPAQLVGHRALIDFGHSEYWSGPELAGWERAVHRGTSLLFFSSDTLGWRARFRPGPGAGGPATGDPVIAAYKEYAARDPDVVDPTGAFPGGGANLTGSAYLGCITPRVPVAGPPTYRYYAWSPSASLAPGWLFAGTGITPQTRIPGIVGYELDARVALGGPARLPEQLVGAGRAPCMAHRFDKPGEPIPAPGPNLAETTVGTATSGATVFATGTLGWELGLDPVPSASPDAPRAPDSRLVALTRNLLSHVLRPSR